MLTPPATPPRFDLQLLGDLCLRDLRTGERIGEPRRKPLALLAVLVTEAPNTVERESLLPLLWPELDLPRARRALAQTLYALRQELGGEDVVVGVAHLSVSPQLTSDLTRWRARCAAGDRDGCRREYGGPLLEGMQVRGGKAFDRWLAEHRTRIDAAHEALLSPVAPAFAGPSAAPRQPATSRLARRRLTATGIAAASLALAAVAALVTRGERATPTADDSVAAPATIWQEWSQLRQAQHEARLAATDSSKIGRLLVLSARNVSRDPSLDKLLPPLDATLRAIHEHEFAQPVSRKITKALEREAAEWRLPVTTDMHMARMLATSGAGLVVRPVLESRADTLFVSMHIYRSIAHTSEAIPGSPNLESERLGGITTGSTEYREVFALAREALVRFTRSLERCDPAFHIGANDAPWCWRTPTRLDLVPGTLEQRQRDWFEQGRKRRAELQSRSLAARSGP